MIEVHLLDGFEQAGELVAFERIEVIERDLGIGNWMARFDTASNPRILEAALDATYLGIEVYDPDSGWRYKGKCLQRQRVLQGNRTPRTIELSGVDHMDDLEAWLEWPDPLNFSNWWGPAHGNLQLSTAVTNELFFQAGPGAIACRQITGLNIVTPAAFGPNKEWVGTGRPLLDSWKDWFEGTAFTMRMRFNRVEPLGTPELRFEPVERATTDVIVSPEWHHGNITIVETAATATHVVGMGEETAAPTRATSQAIGTENSWLTGHREKFINRPTANQNELDDEVADTLASLGPRLSARVDDIVIPTYGDTAFIGDYVTVAFAQDEPDFLAPIASMRLTGTAAGWSRTASVGSEVEHPAQRLTRRIRDLRDQVNRVEGDLR